MTEKVAKWIAVDWGTSNLRAWIFDAQDQLIAEPNSDAGMGSLKQDDFEQVLLSLIAPYLSHDDRVQVVCCGMVGARQGWLEAPYVSVPFDLPVIENSVLPQTSDARLDVRILPGAAQRTPADVMRGEETQLAGFVACNPNFEGVVCLPGTHTKWVRLVKGRVEKFRTYVTGELFALLASQSVLRFSVDTHELDEPAFVSAVSHASKSADHFTSSLFSLRAGSLLEATPPKITRARLSGMVLGQELSGAKEFWQDQRVALIGNEKLLDLYSIALASLGVDAIRCSGDEMVLAGLRAAYTSIMEHDK